ncbi:hypothetical protein NSZ01_12360 [Nocardioides szechwanensis]|uniref:Uncharacterized protein n=1 Tax=Nocardioides szechwanensis TaxID=1005944 RepID=A0A1H0CD04_9ACTN|nr:hypothetical protein [Nocardioides szechwanensis]GEP33468.1 hypothetical protein NSZ01_12360 [Nocardioides szechwanensis]SDN55661.1 hypothetical protein SAMN05192576_2386 [Nocardioides szechwanensis]
MNSYRRAFGDVVTTALIGSGLVLGVGSPATATATATATAPAPSAAQADVLGVITAPLLSGVGQVGQTLTVAPPVWDLLSPLDVVSNSYQWLRDGVPIPGATDLTYAVTTDDAGHQITTRVTGTLLGLIPLVGTALSNGIDIPLPIDPDPDPDPGAVLTALVAPVLTGVPAVGELLSLSQVEWSLPGVTTTIQWLSDGVPIPGAQGLSFIPGAEHAGTEITAVVTGTLAGIPIVQLLTNGLGIPLVGAPGTPVATAFPIPTGTGKVGTLLTGTAPAWNTSDVVTTYQWQRNTIPIPGATSLTYTVKPEDFGKALRLTATGTKGDAIGTASSATVLGKLGDLLAETAPSISGVAKAGNVLTVQPGAWGLGTLPTFGYQWYLDNQPITGATNSQYVVKVTDAGRRLAVLVNVTRLGFTPASAAAGPVTVPKVASKTTLKLLKKKIKQGKAGLLRITLAPGSLRPSGKVKIFDGRKLRRPTPCAWPTTAPGS